MPKYQHHQDSKSNQTEDFLIHVEETTDLLENTNAKDLLKKAIQQIRTQNKQDYE